MGRQRTGKDGDDVVAACTGRPEILRRGRRDAWLMRHCTELGPARALRRVAAMAGWGNCISRASPISAPRRANPGAWEEEQKQQKKNKGKKKKGGRLERTIWLRLKLMRMAGLAGNAQCGQITFLAAGIQRAQKMPITRSPPWASQSGLSWASITREFVHGAIFGA